MTRWDLKINEVASGQVVNIPPAATSVLIEGDVCVNASLQGAAKNLRVQINGHVKPDSNINLKGPNASLKVKRSISGAVILLEGCSFNAVGNAGWLDPKTHVHTRGACSQIEIGGRGHGYLVVEPHERESIKVRLERDVQIVAPAPVMRSANWLPHLLPGMVPQLPEYDRKRSSAIYGAFTIPAFNRQYREYLAKLPSLLNAKCAYCSDLRATLSKLQ
ncbi:MAG TPA: hypothetical protein VD907_06485 [Verrucomicrobiae bacterium]|nr:hypothetical protein [Verrucomicrobiae bacterium]